MAPKTKPKKKKKMAPKTKFEDKDYDLSRNFCCLLIHCDACEPYSIKLHLGPDEATMEYRACLKNVTNTERYENMKKVEKQKCCGSTSIFVEGLGSAAPGCECSDALVDEVVEEIKKRQAAKGMKMERD